MDLTEAEEADLERRLDLRQAWVEAVEVDMADRDADRYERWLAC